MCDSRTQKWIDKVLAKYPQNADLFDYSQVVVVGCKEKVNIICKQCGKVFPQTPDAHLNLGRGCPDCRKAQAKKNSGASRKGKANLNRRSSTEEWIAKVLAKHPEFADKYDYSQAVYTKTDEPVTIICKTCGRVCTPKARKHMEGQGCKSCAGRKSAEKSVPTFPEMVKRAQEVHGDEYEYFEDSYICMSKEMMIRHKKCGNVFSQRPEFHIGKKQGCPFCQHVVSSGEKGVLAFVKEHTHCEVQNNVRIVPDFFVGSKRIHKAELGIYIPELKLAIEYNGTHFHDISLKGKGYHIGKRKACEKLEAFA